MGENKKINIVLWTYCTNLLFCKIIILKCKNKSAHIYKGVVKQWEGSKVQAIVVRPCPLKRPEIFIGNRSG